MSGAPRVELNNTQTDFDLATPNGTPDLINQMDGSPSHVNGSANSDLQNSAIKAKNGILETASNAMNAANNHPSVQNAKQTVMNGKICE